MGTKLKNGLRDVAFCMKRIGRSKRFWSAAFMFHPALKRRFQLCLQYHLAHSLGFNNILDRSRQSNAKPSSYPHPQLASEVAALIAAPVEVLDETARRALQPQLVRAAEIGDLEKVVALLGKGLEVNWQSESGDTALSIASRSGHLPIVKLLLSKGADSYLYDHQGVSPLMKACRNGHAAIAKVLLGQGEADAFHEAQQRSALIEAAAGGYLDCIKVLIDIGGVEASEVIEESGNHALLEAAAHGHLQAVKLLVENGARVNRVDKTGHSALFIAARNGDVHMVEYLLSKRAKSIPEYQHKFTPLKIAAVNGHVATVKALVEAGHFSKEAEGTDSRSICRLSGNPRIREILQAALPKA